MNYYYCAYGHVIRVSQKCRSEAEAAKYCFGVTDRVTCLNVGSRSPAYFSQKKKAELQAQLTEMHKQRIAT